MRLYLNSQVKNTAGMTLVELTIVASIIALLGHISIFYAQNFQIRARQAEARANTRAIAALQISYLAEHDSLYFGNWSGITRLWSPSLSEDDYSSVTSCHRANDLGFRLNDCTKARYYYSVFNIGISNTNVAAIEGGTASGSWPVRRVAPHCAGVWTNWLGDMQLMGDAYVLQVGQNGNISELKFLGDVWGGC